MKVCSFCGKTEEHVKRIITSPKADICGECVVLCMEILLSELTEFTAVEFQFLDKTNTQQYDTTHHTPPPTA
jgi:ATP-dependent protease Clp ATPase subunit